MPVRIAKVVAEVLLGCLLPWLVQMRGKHLPSGILPLYLTFLFCLASSHVCAEWAEWWLLTSEPGHVELPRRRWFSSWWPMLHLYRQKRRERGLRPTAATLHVLFLVVGMVTMMGGLLVITVVHDVLRANVP